MRTAHFFFASLLTLGIGCGAPAADDGAQDGDDGKADTFFKPTLKAGPSNGVRVTLDHDHVSKNVLGSLGVQGYKFVGRANQRVTFRAAEINGNGNIQMVMYDGSREGDLLSSSVWPLAEGKLPNEADHSLAEMTVLFPRDATFLLRVYGTVNDVVDVSAEAPCVSDQSCTSGTRCVELADLKQCD